MNPNVKFLHYRRFNNDDSTTSPLSRGGATVAYLVRDNGSIDYATAYCHPNDNYNKTIGRAKAEGRTKSRNYSDFVEMNEEEFRTMMDSELASSDLYRRTWA